MTAGSSAKVRKMMKKIIAVLLVILIAAATAACGSPKDAGDKTFTCEEMSITLTEGFKEKQYAGYTVCYDSTEAAVYVLKESKDEVGKERTFDEYVEAVKKNNASRGFELTETKTIDGLTSFEYQWTNADQEIVYRFLTTIHEAKDAYWIVQFVTPGEMYDKYEEYFVKWAKTVTFA